MIVYLIGMRASGKTSVGNLLSKKLHWNFIDLDSELEKQENRTVSEIVNSDGWNFFRDLETKILQNIDISKDLVVSTGGGIILRSENRQFMIEHGEIFYLNVPINILFDRLIKENEIESRPSLTNEKSSLEELSDVYESRKDIYKGLATYEINAIKSIDFVSEQIFRIVNKVRYVWPK